jgi:periplasmic protein TonB
MGNLNLLKNPRPALRGDRAGSNLTHGPREEDSYNRSSLALEAVPAYIPKVQRVTLPLAMRPGVHGGARRAGMFLDLDETVSRRGRDSTVSSLIVHSLVISVILWWGLTSHPHVVQSEETVSPVQFTLYAPAPPPPPVMPVAKVRGGGGGGGAHQLRAPRTGHLPEVAKIRVVPLEPPRIERPQLPVAPTMQVRLPEESKLANLGAPQTAQVAMAAQGSGGPSGFGIGFGGGVGQGHGTGFGQGSNGGYGGGVMNVGGGVSAPEVLHSVEPQFTAEARQANYQGVVSIQLIVDAQGFPQDARVVRHLGMGLDERALEAVRQYRFKPALYQGHPVAVQMVVDVDFRLH